MLTVLIFELGEENLSVAPLVITCTFICEFLLVVTRSPGLGPSILSIVRITLFYYCGSNVSAVGGTRCVNGIGQVLQVGIGRHCYAIVFSLIIINIIKRIGCIRIYSITRTSKFCGNSLLSWRFNSKRLATTWVNG